jgi:hypothetical protein
LHGIGLSLGLARRSQGLFRTANQAKLADFLARDFSAGPAGEPGRQAAAKNAFVLISQHRAELAAAFFVLGAPYLCLGAGLPLAAAVTLASRTRRCLRRAAAQQRGVGCRARPDVTGRVEAFKPLPFRHHAPGVPRRAAPRCALSESLSLHAALPPVAPDSLRARCCALNPWHGCCARCANAGLAARLHLCDAPRASPAHGGCDGSGARAAQPGSTRTRWACARASLATPA